MKNFSNLRAKSSAVLLLSGSFFAFADQAVAQTVIAQSAQTQPAKDSANEQGSSEIIVTGTSIRGVAPAGANVITLGRDDILATGANTTQTLLASVPQLTAFNTRPRPNPGGGNPTTSPDIHNVGPAATLTLVNGHRVVALGTLSNSVDPSAIPPSMLERVEIVPGGASAVYGSDAISGVVNFITRRNLNGLELGASYGRGDSYHEFNFNGAFGQKWKSGSFVIGGQYTGNSNLSGGDRSFVTSDLRRFGGSDNRTNAGPFPNVTITTGSGSGAVTNVYTGPNNTLNPNGPELYDSIATQDLIPRERRWSVYTTFRQEVSDRIRLIGDAGYTNRRTTITNGPPGVNFTITRANPYFRDFGNTAATSAQITMDLSSIPGSRSIDTQILKTFDANVGLEADLFSGWVGKLEATYGKSTSDITQRAFESASFNAAVASTDPATAFDPFGGHTNPSILTFARNLPFNKQGLYEFRASLDGTLFELPGGAVKVALGAARRHESQDATLVNKSSTGAINGRPLAVASSRNVTSAYGEVFFPVVGEANTATLVKSLSLSIAGRYDRYSDAGDTFNPKFGATWEPIGGLFLKGTYSRSFRAPSLSQGANIGDQVVVWHNFSAPGLFTPPGSNLLYDVILAYGGNPNLKPETSKTWSLGFDYKPNYIPGFKASASLFDLKYRGLVAVGLDLGYYSNPALTARNVTINPTATQLAALVGTKFINCVQQCSSLADLTLPGTQHVLLNDLFSNYGGKDVRGIDFNISYNFRPAFGTIGFGIAGTYFIRNKFFALPGTTANDDLQSGAVKLVHRSYLTVTTGKLAASLFVNYTGPYNNVINSSVTPHVIQRVNSFTTTDLNMAFDFGGNGFLGGFTGTLNAENIFNQSPPPYNGFSRGDTGSIAGGINYALASPLGRVITVGVRKKF